MVHNLHDRSNLAVYSAMDVALGTAAVYVQPYVPIHIYKTANMWMHITPVHPSSSNTQLCIGRATNHPCECGLKKQT